MPTLTTILRGGDPQVSFSSGSGGEFQFHIDDERNKSGAEFLYRLSIDTQTHLEPQFGRLEPGPFSTPLTLPVKVEGATKNLPAFPDQAPDLEALYEYEFDLNRRPAGSVIWYFERRFHNFYAGKPSPVDVANLPAVAYGVLGAADAKTHRFTFKLESQQRMAIDALASRAGTSLRPRLTLFKDSAIVSQPWQTVAEDTYGLLKLGPGEYTLEIADADGQWGPDYRYRLLLYPEPSDFHVDTDLAGISAYTLMRGQTVAVTLEYHPINGPLKPSVGFRLEFPGLPTWLKKKSVSAWELDAGTGTYHATVMFEFDYASEPPPYFPYAVPLRIRAADGPNLTHLVRPKGVSEGAVDLYPSTAGLPVLIVR